jgi:cytochrome P450
VTAEALEADLHGVLARLRASEPVSWVPALGGWLVTPRDLVVELMRDAERFTVDDPRFSTGQVLGPSMLSLDGQQHARHRQPFADAFRPPEVRGRYADAVERAARDRVGGLTPRGAAELRRELAGPLAVDVMELTLELVGTDAATLLGWYDEIVSATTAIADGAVGAARPTAVALLGEQVRRTVEACSGVLAEAARSLTLDEVVSNTGVMLFGGLETSEGATANALLLLLTTPGALEAVRAEPDLVGNAVDESLRLEPSVVRLDRYATVDVEVAGAHMEAGEFVMLSLAAANRDPAVFPDPDVFDVRRANARQHVTFAHGPHLCPGMHLARVETEAAVRAALDAWPGLRLDPSHPAPAPAGTIFRKPDALRVVW